MRLRRGCATMKTWRENSKNGHAIQWRWRNSSAISRQDRRQIPYPMSELPAAVALGKLGRAKGAR